MAAEQLSSLRQRGKLFSTDNNYHYPFGNDDDMKKYTIQTVGERIYLLIVVFYGLLFFLALTADRHLPEPKTIADDGHKSGVFIEQRARHHLVTLTSLGPRVVGSYENEVLAVELLLREINFIKQKSKPHWNFEVDVQKPTGSFNLLFQDGFTSYYSKVKNVLVKLEPKAGAKHSLLVNCHFDTAAGSPGASDDAVSCAIMLEVLNILAQSDYPLVHSIVFSFNGAEENVLQAAHGFITQHPWARQVRAFVNLEACGAGGREIVFQAGPENPWLVQAYAENVPHPFASVIGQEIFKSGVIPGDTDYRIYRDYGNIPGLDIAYVKNGYVYHTKYDTQDYVPPGTIQRAGENMLELIKHLAVSPLLPDPGLHRHGNLVFFDVLGLFLISYSDVLGILLNLSSAVIGLLALRKTMITSKKSGLEPKAFFINIGASITVILISWLFALISVVLIAFAIDCLGANMSWYTHNFWVVGLYSAPTVAAQVFVQRLGASFQKKLLFPPSVHVDKMWLLEELYFEACRVIWLILLIGLTLFNCRSSFLFMIWVLVPTIIRSYGGQYLLRRKASAYHFVFTYMAAQAIPSILAMYAAVVIHYIFLPIMGRAGSNINPDVVVGIITCAFTILLTNYMMSIVHTTHSVNRLFMTVAAIAAASFFAVSFTPLGFPYSSDAIHPTPQRYLVMHVDRSFQNQSGEIRKEDSGIWVMPMDYNGPATVFPHVTELQTAHPVQPDCNTELYCGMPFYLPVLTVLGKTYFIAGPKPKIHHPVRLRLVSQKAINIDTRRMTFNVTGPTHMAVFLSPSLDVTLVNWSFADGVPVSGPKLGPRSTYFIYYSHGETSEPWVFWFDLKVPVAHPKKELLVTVALTSHNLHGPDSMSDELEVFLNKFPDWAVAVGWTGSYQSWDYFL